MTTKRLFVLVVTLAAIAGSIVGAHAFAGAKGPVAPSVDGLEDVNFVSLCRFSHRGADDPIVFPGKTGLSHDHMFFGSTTTDANSTPASLLGKQSTCDPTTDTAAYWTPTLIVNGTKVEALDVAAYYRRNTIAKVQAFPPGFMMIGGDSTSFALQSTNVTFWGCSLEVTSRFQQVPNCGKANLRLHVIFPECWDGTRLDSPDHKSHMAYAVNGVCPADHPVALPQLVLIFRYPTNGEGNVTLASLNTPNSGHADFVNGWDQATLQRLVDYCLNAFRPCGSLR
jgi:hypothetical protein